MSCRVRATAWNRGADSSSALPPPRPRAGTSAGPSCARRMSASLFPFAVLAGQRRDSASHSKEEGWHEAGLEEMTMWCRAVGCILTLTLSLLMALLAADAQPTGKVPRIGVIMQGVPPGEAGDELDVLRQGLRDLGYVEGQTIALEVRWGQWQPERHPALATDLVQRPVDVIVAAASPARAAQHATTTIPIVRLVGTDPVAQGLVASLARPAGNITGLDHDGPRVKRETAQAAHRGRARPLPCGASRGCRKPQSVAPTSTTTRSRPVCWGSSCCPWRCGVPTSSWASSKRPCRHAQALLMA